MRIGRLGSKVTESKAKGQATGWLQRVPANPLITIALLIFAVLGIVLAVVIPIVVSKASNRERDLVYAVNPVYTRIVTAGQASNLEVRYGGVSLGDANVTAVQIAIWNKGKESIRPENVLENIVIYTDPPSPILGADIRTQSRAVVQFTLPDSSDSLAKGELQVSWRILEQDDGASIQLIFLGSDNVNVLVRGAVEGEKQIQRINIGVTTRLTPEPLLHKDVGLATSLLTMGCLFFGMVAIFVIRQRWHFQRVDYMLGAFGICLIVSGLWFLLKPGPIIPPFGF